MKAGWVRGGDKKADICNTSNNKGKFKKKTKTFLKLMKLFLFYLREAQNLPTSPF